MTAIRTFFAEPTVAVPYAAGFTIAGIVFDVVLCIVLLTYPFASTPA